MISAEGHPVPSLRGKWFLRAAPWTAFFTLIAWAMVATWGLSFWPSVALFAVYVIGIAIPLGAALGSFIRRRPPARCQLNS
ncbi:hypothetical protein [Arthrobacter sp. NPDC058192]|uniref:hypothetical protein n=1 Tax=Arthrobacter sp. NPDC058192 TaxID=3346372 RepID=UPI0036E44A44